MGKETRQKIVQHAYENIDRLYSRDGLLAEWADLGIVGPRDNTGICSVIADSFAIRAARKEIPTDPIGAFGQDGFSGVVLRKEGDKYRWGTFRELYREVY